MIYVNVSPQDMQCQYCKVRERLYHFSYEHEGLFFDDICLNCLSIQFTDLQASGDDAKIIISAMNKYQRSPYFSKRRKVIVCIDDGEL